MTCEECWEDAYIASCTLGGSQVDHYQRLLRERDNWPAHIENNIRSDEKGAA